MIGELSARVRARIPTGRGARRVATVAIGALSIGAVLFVAPLGQVLETVAHLSPWWVAAAVDRSAARPAVG